MVKSFLKIISHIKLPKFVETRNAVRPDILYGNQYVIPCLDPSSRPMTEVATYMLKALVFISAIAFKGPSSDKKS